MNKRFCPVCNKELNYKSESSYKIANLENRKCRSCSNIGKHNFTDDEKKIISGKLIGRIFSNETKEKMSMSQKGKIRTDEYKLKMSIACQEKKLIGENSPNFGKVASTETREKMSMSQKGRTVSDETKMKISNGNRGKIRTDDYKSKMSEIKKGKLHTLDSKLKMRLSRIKEIETKCQIIPNYNKKACYYFDEMMKMDGNNIQHAENGGEFKIKELGYWLDGYDKENNIVYEYDENTILIQMVN